MGPPAKPSGAGSLGRGGAAESASFHPCGGGNEAYGACDDEEQEKALALLLRLGGHFRPQCGRFQGLELALFRPTRFEIGAVFSQKPPESPL